jgi:hypothetical protein
MKSSKWNNAGISLRKLHNPKSHAPAVYIPCWLIQVPQNELSHLAKILYGRLAQWSNTKGYVSRSAPQLSAEMGCQVRVIKRGLKELRDVGLIETHQIKKGGINSFIFLDHEFMHRPLQDCLDYYEQHTPTTPVSSSVESAPVDNYTKPSDKNVPTPGTKMSLPRDKNVPLKYKEIKEIEKDKSFCASAQKKLKSSQSSQPTPIPTSALSPKRSKADWKTENAKRPDWADKIDRAAESTKQMESEARHIEEHEALKRAPMPDSLRSWIKNMKVAYGGGSYDRAKDGQRMQKHAVQVRGEARSVASVNYCKTLEQRR